MTAGDTVRDAGTQVRGTPPLVGRAAEMEALEDALSAGAAGRGSVVFIAGEPGIGKSRLVEELAKLAAGRFALHIGDCFEGEQAMPYRPWMDVLRSMGAADGLDAATRHGGLASLLPATAESPSVIQDEDAEDTGRLRLFDGVLSIVRPAAARHPLLVIFEDMHWADPSTVALFRHVARRVTRLPVVLAVTYRSTEVTAGHPLLTVVSEALERRFGKLLNLDGLDVDAIGELFTASTGWPADPEQLARLHSRTNGNPYFLQEILRSDREAGRDTEAPVPRAVIDVIKYRLSKRSRPCASLLDSAAILGRTFSAPAVKELTDLTNEEMEAALTEASSAHLVEPLSRAQAAQYRFVHSLVQETLLALLPATTAQALHLRAAEAIEKRADGHGEMAAILSRHYRLAHSPAALERLIATSTAAIRYAADDCAWDEARETFERTLAELERVGATDSQRAAFTATVISGPFQRLGLSAAWLLEVAEPAAETLFSEGRKELATGLLSAAFWALVVDDSFEALDPVRAFRLRERILEITNHEFIRTQLDGNLPMLLMLVQRLEEMKTVAEALLESPYPAARAGALIYLANYLLYNGSIADAREKYRTAWEATTLISVAEAPVIIAIGAMACGWATGAWWRLRAPLQQEALVERELQMRRQPSKLRDQLQILRAHARIDRGIGADSSEQLRLRNRQPKSWISVSVDWVAFREGKWEAAITGMQASLRRLHPDVLDDIAMLSELVVEAWRHISPVSALAAIPEWQFESHVPLCRVTAHSLAGVISAEIGDFEALRHHAKAARASMTDDDWLGLGARVELLESVVALVDGEDETSRRLFDVSTANMRRVEHPWDEADAHFVYGKALTYLERSRDANQHFEAALAVLTRIQAAEPFLSRVRSAMPEVRTNGTSPSLRRATDQLSAREEEVLALLVEGRSNRDIAATLLISEPTVATHVRHILEKTGTANRTEAAAFALRSGLVNPADHRF